MNDKQRRQREKRNTNQEEEARPKTSFVHRITRLKTRATMVTAAHSTRNESMRPIENGTSNDGRSHESGKTDKIMMTNNDGVYDDTAYNNITIQAQASAPVTVNNDANENDKNKKRSTNSQIKNQM